MVIAALICFAILLVAWIVAPDGHTKPDPVASEAEAIPVAV
jgi:hypothetical protein